MHDFRVYKERYNVEGMYNLYTTYAWDNILWQFYIELYTTAS